MEPVNDQTSSTIASQIKDSLLEQNSREYQYLTLSDIFRHIEPFACRTYTLPSR